MSAPDIYDSFKGKNVFFTGVTGFVGKVFLYKMLKEFTDIGNIYVLARAKKGVAMEDRFAKDVMGSKCFHPLIAEIGEKEWLRRTSKVKAVAGDITFHHLGLSDANYSEICANVNIIVHLAATVNFDEKLNLSCEMNVLGSVRVMALAHKCKFLESYIHTSTCYVNHSMHGKGQRVKEQLYPLPFDAESMLKYILSLSPMQIPKETKRLLEQYKYPNTYTFTKSITEHILMQQRGNLPLVIVRPAIIGCAWREPYHGWVDALTAAGGLLLVAGLGLMHELIGDGEGIADIVPVDHVVNTILKVTHRSILYHKPTSLGRIVEQRGGSSISNNNGGIITTTSGGKKSNTVAMTSLAAIVNLEGKSQADVVAAAGSLSTNINASPGPQQRKSLATWTATSSAGGSSDDPGALSHNFPRVYHSATSSTMNTLKWQTTIEGTCDYWNPIKHPKSLGKAYMIMYPKEQWAMNFYGKRVLPVSLALKLGKLPGLQNAKREKLLLRYQKATTKVEDLARQFSPFTLHTWSFENNNSLENLEEGCLSKTAQSAFSTDIFDINWYHYIQVYSWGLITFIMKDDGVKPPMMPLTGSGALLRASL